MIDQGSLTGSIGAYLTGVAVTSAPWLLTTSVLMSLRLVARGHGADEDFRSVESMLTVVYALTVVLSAPIHVVVSRYASDRLYERRADRIGAPVRRALALTLVGFAAVGVVLMVILRVPLGAGIAGTLLTVVIGAQWLMLSVGGGMSSPLTVLRAFGVGAPLSLIASVVLDRWFAYGAVGYLYGFGAGQLVTLVVLLHGVARAIPADSDESARLMPAFAEYKLLAISALAYYLSIWSDKLIVYWLIGREAAALYAAVAALAWFSVIPAFAWIYVQIETAFYRRFRAFYDAVEGGAPLQDIQQRAESVSGEVARILRGAAMVQAATTALAMGGAPLLTAFVGLPPVAVTPFRFAVVGAALQVITLLEILLLYYFDLRRDALRISVALLGCETALAVVCRLLGWTPALGYAVACAVACAAGALVVRRRLTTLVLDTFQSQPFAGRM
jgi:uncharacterized membrane protein